MAGSLHTNGTHAPLRSHIMQNSMHHHHHMLSNGNNNLGQQESTNYMIATQQPTATATHSHHHIPQQQQLKAHCSQQQQPHWGNENVHGIPDDPSRGYYKSDDALGRLQPPQQLQDNNTQYKYNGSLVREVSFNVGIEVESCVNAGSFTNVHYGSRAPISMDGINPSSAVGDHGFAPHEELRSREDSLDLYSGFRDDSYSENSDDFSNESGEAANRLQPSTAAPMHTVNQLGMTFQGNHVQQQQQMHTANIYPESDYFNVNHGDYHGHNTGTNQMGHQAYQQHPQSYGRQHEQFPMASLPSQDMYSTKPSDFFNGYHNHAHPTAVVAGVPSSCIYTSNTQQQQIPTCGQPQLPMCQQLPPSQQPQINPMGFHQGGNNLMDGSTSGHMLPGYTDLGSMGQYGKLEHYTEVPAIHVSDVSNGEGIKPAVKGLPQMNRMDEINRTKGSSSSGEGEKSSSDEDGLTENFGEIIKKTMVETVSA